MNLLERLRTFGAYIMDQYGNESEFTPNPLTTAAADEIERLQKEVEHYKTLYYNSTIEP